MGCITNEPSEAQFWGKMLNPGARKASPSMSEHFLIASSRSWVRVSELEAAWERPELASDHAV
jgi:hypothetical protein